MAEHFRGASSRQGKTILDLGCAVGDQAAEFVPRGAHVIGVDMNEELLQEARSRRLPNAKFLTHDLLHLPELGVLADGLWCSFAASSPVIIHLAGEPAGALKDKDAVGDHWAQALQLNPNLRFELLSMLVGVNSITLYYRSVRGLAAAVFHFGPDQKVIRAYPHYASWETLDIVLIRVAIIGNSGSGKSTLARRLAADQALPTLDLDTVSPQSQRLNLAAEGTGGRPVLYMVVEKFRNRDPVPVYRRFREQGRAGT